MKISSLIVEFHKDKGEETKKALLLYDNLTIYGEKDNKIVVVIESNELVELTKIIDEISNNSLIKSVIPVYISDI